jgi:hypothetical protein
LGDGNGHRLRIRETEDLRVAYAGPFQMGAEEMPENLQHFAAATGRSGNPLDRALSPEILTAPD